ncbi:MAG TPA: ABC transporter permease [Vicinamibacterales bacterium]|jgi:putative ABC transport system permease protein|nr:ABC transporter permease [Vicinamibacterales bacterium]
MIGRLFAALRGLLRRRRIQAEIAEELRDHLEREVEAHVLRGLPPEEARRLALRDLGGLTQTIEATRAVRATWLDAFWRDLAYAARVLRRSPRFTLTALILLVVAIGSTTAIFSIAYAVLVRPLPYPEADRLVFVAGYDGAGVIWPNFEEWRSRARSFDSLASSLADAVIVTGGPIPRRFESRSVTANFFRVLGVRPVQGRLFDDADARPDAALTAMVSHAFWMRELGGAPGAIGQTLSINRKAFTLIGVLPPGFRYMTPADVYILLEPQVAANYRGMQSRNTRTTLYAVGRLKSGVSVTAARAEMQTIAAALALKYGATAKGSDVTLVALADRVVGDMAPTLTVVTGAVMLLLLIACVNLAGLLLNRSASRAHEFSIRSAIGGSRWALIRQLLIEQALLVVTGGVLGALAGAAILTVLVRVAPREMPRLDEIRLDIVVLTWTTLFSSACAFLFGILPAVKASGVSGQELVVRSGRGSTRPATALRKALMLAEITVATVLLSGAGLMVHTMVRLSRVDPGFDPHNLQTFMFSLTGPQWPDARKQVFYDAVVERLRAVPGVENAAVTYSLPTLGSNWWNVFNFPGKTREDWISVGEFPNAGMVPVTAGYFETLRIPLIKGRYFNRSDTPDSLPVAIVNSSLARKYWLNEDPVGKQVRQGFPTEPFGPWRTIVAVVGDIKQEGVDRETSPQVFMPIVQQPRTTVFAIARTRATVTPSSLEMAIHELDRTIPVFNDRTIDQVMREASSRRRIAMIVLSVFGGVAVLLAAIGIYGVIAQGVAERRQEIGVRMALGATGGQILRLFLRHGLAIVAVGIPCGIVAAVAAARSLASLVFGVTVTDPATLGTAAAVLTAVTLLACYVPACSATRVDPLEALRSE